jgi:hypothetical protein
VAGSSPPPLERILGLLEDLNILKSYCFIWSVEIGEPVEEACGFLVYETTRY